MFETFYLIGLVFLLVKLWRKEHYESGKNSMQLPPGRMGIPLIGETIQFALKKAEFFRQKRRIYGPVFKTHLLGKPTIRVSGQELVRKIILGENKIVQSSYPSAIKKILGPKSLTMSSGEKHKNRKRQVMQFLSPEFLAQHISSFSKLISASLTRMTANPFVDIYSECRLISTELAAKYLVSMDINPEDYKRIKELYEDFSDNLFTFPINLPGFGYHKAVHAKKELRKIFRRIANDSGKSSRDYCSVLEAYGASLQDDSEFSEDDFLDAIVELLWNASETVSSAAFSIIYLLTRHPDVLKQVRQELEDTNEEGVTMDNLKDLKVVDSVVRETLRLMPPIGGGYRKVLESFSLQGYTIPKDWTVVFGIRETHENDSSLLDPLEFDPSRWRNKEKDTSSISYFPFGGGARVCPGKAYAMIVLQLFTIQLCQQCHWKFLRRDPELSFFPTPRPKHNLNVCFFNRN